MVVAPARRCNRERHLSVLLFLAARIGRVSPRRLKYAVDSAPIHFRYAASEINYQPLATQDIRAPRHDDIPDEGHGVLAHVEGEADRTIAIHIDGSSFPNWNEADQKRIFAITGDQLKLTAHIGATVGTAEVVWKRAQ